MTTNDSAGVGERRASRRHKTLKAGRIALNNMCSVVDCTIADVSEAGVRLEVPYGVDIPDAFAVTGGDGGYRECAVVWRTNTRIGVRFIDADAGVGAGRATTPAESDLVSLSSEVRRALLDRIDAIQHQLNAIREELRAEHSTER
ncbi:MAG: PilZ domain-containing protein [Rhodospirillales bacterium]|nr:PilZ domain-containing protein [Rhodospirillales bacterium]